MTYAPPRRWTSSATTVTINSTATALSAAAAALSSNSWGVFLGPTTPTAQYGLSYEQNHPVSGLACDPTEDGSQTTGHSAISWFGKGCYDPTTKRVTWASTGAGNLYPGGYVYNTQPFYDEALNRWTVSRGFRSLNEASSNADPTGHGYDNNCISVSRRRLYKTKLSQCEIMVYDLDNNTWLNQIDGAYFANLEGYSSPGAMDYIPSRDALWRFTYKNGFMRLLSLDLTTTNTWSVVLDGVWGTPVGYGGCMSFNPRAYSNAGGVMIGESGCWRVNTTGTATATSVGLPAGITMTMETAAHLCRDPVGDGWFWVNPNNRALWKYSFAGGWQSVSTVPSGIDLGAFLMVPIDDYGVIWFIGSNVAAGDSTRAYLYKP